HLYGRHHDDRYSEPERLVHATALRWRVHRLDHVVSAHINRWRGREDLLPVRLLARHQQLEDSQEHHPAHESERGGAGDRSGAVGDTRPARDSISMALTNLLSRAQ